MSISNESNQYLEVDNIRVVPSEMIFENPFEGKHFRAKLVIQNIGKSSAFVRILEPSASGVVVKSLRRGANVPPGLKITRTVRYSVNMATLIDYCIIPIYINKHLIDYKIFVRAIPFALTVEPDYLDFGVVDAGYSTTRRICLIRNLGPRPEVFRIDLGENTLNLNVDPMKGVVTNAKPVEINIEVSLFQTGTYTSEFWIIAKTPLCVKILLKVVYPNIETVFQEGTPTFTLLHFTSTYFGSKSTQAILLRNKSQESSMFYVTGIIDGASKTFHKMGNLPGDFKHYDGYPLSGRLHANDIRPFIFTFAPKLSTNTYYNYNYMLVTVKINKLYCKDVENFGTPVFPELKNNLIQAISNITLKESNVDVFEDTDSFERSKEEYCEFEPAAQYYESSVRIMLYGVAEKASISFRPDEFEFIDVKIGEQLIRTLMITNDSGNLPIVFRHVHTECIDMKPRMSTLQPKEAIEVEVLVTPRSTLEITSSIVFELLHWDRPRLTNDFVKVGLCKIPLHITTCAAIEKIEAPELASLEFKKPFIKPNILAMKRLIENDAIPALTVDIRSILRPWKDEKVVMTPYATIPRLKNTYDSSQDELQKKLFNHAIFKKYVREMYEQHRKQQLQGQVIFEEYDVSNELTCVTTRRVSTKARSEPNFIPLTPQQLYNITLEPRNTILESVATRSHFETKIKIRNDNKVSLRIYIRPHKPDFFLFPYGNRFIVNSESELVIEYICISGNVGIQYLILDIVVNESHIFEATITAHVKPTSLNFSFTSATFSSRKSASKYLELTNLMNTNIDFNWEYIGNFNIYPKEGYVPAKKTITCRISYEIGTCPNAVNMLNIRIDYKKYKCIYLRIEKPKINIVFKDKISFGNFGTNTTMEKILKISNPTKHKFVFEITSVEFEGLTVIPTSGTFYPNSAIFFSFRITRSEPGEFNTKVIINIAHGFKYFKIDIDGCIVFPVISSTPPCLRFLKISASSFDVKCFKLENYSDVKAKITFDVEAFPEIKFSEYSDSPNFQKGDYIFIEPKKSKLIVAHFYPQYAQANSFYLPLLVNNLPRVGSHRTTNTKFYTKVVSHKIVTNTWFYNFEYIPHYVNNSSIQLIKLTAYKGPIKFLIRKDELKAPFWFNHIEGGICTIDDISIVCTLNGDGETAIFEAKFEPVKPGEYILKLPVFVKDDFYESAHNYITLKGNYPESILKFHINTIYVGFLPLNFPIVKKIYGVLKYHAPACIANASCRNVNIEFETFISGDGIEKTICLRIIYFSKTNHVLDDYISFKCTCGCKKMLKIVGGATNSLLTNHACLKYFSLNNRVQDSIFDPDFSFVTKDMSNGSKTTIDSSNAERRKPNKYPTTLPFFPPKEHVLHEYMNHVVDTVEQWLYDQGYHGITYHKIPDTLAEIEVTFPSKVKSKKQIFGRVSSPCCQILANLCGPQFKYHVTTEFDENAPLLPRVIRLYTQILELLKSLGCYLPHVSPEYLLTYNLYEEYKNSDEKLTYESFYSISKQCWLDVILQSYSNFLYNKTTTTGTITKKKSLQYQSASSLDFYDVSAINGFIYSDYDAKLIAWFGSKWDSMKHRLMTSEFGNEFCHELLERKISDYDKDFADGLAFASATIALCPYLSEYYSSLYVPPRREVEYYHNAYLNIKVWEIVQIGLHFSPEDLINCNSVRTAILCNYLYVFLKNLKVAETITFRCNLTEIVDEVLYIVNDNNNTIRYKAIFFSNERQAFSLDQEYIIVKPNETYKLTIHYSAKFAKKESATIALCGEIPGSKCTQSKVFMLEGIPLLNEPFGEYYIKSRTYEITPIKLEISAPHISTQYEIYIANSLPSDVDELNLIPYAYFFKSKLLDRLIFMQESCKSDEKGVIFIPGWGLSISLLPKSAWVFFKNPEIGDFFILVILKSTPTKMFSEIILNLPQTFSLFTCNCDKQVADWKNQKCPRNVVFKVPFSNEIMWRSLLVYYTTKLYTDAEDCVFWERYKDNEIGLNVFKRLLLDNKETASAEMSYMFNTKVKFSVSTDDSTIVVQPTVVLDDLIDSYKTADITIHLNSQPDTIQLTLTSSDRREKRLYNLIISYTNEKK